MINLKWHKLSKEKKAHLQSPDKKAFLMAPTIVKENRLHSIVKNLVKDNELVIIGVLLDNWIPGLEGEKHFKPASKPDLMKILENFNEKVLSKILLLEYRFENTKYIIRELQPNRVIAFNGTWKNVIHYQDFWWEAYDQGVEIETITPFESAKEAQAYSKKVTGNLEKEFIKKFNNKKFYSAKEIKNLLNELAIISWDWTGRVGAIITNETNKDKYELLSWGYNKVLPYNAYMYQSGSIREKQHAQTGKSLELGETVHAEISAILNAAESGVSLKNSEIWVSFMPCPYCARAIATSPIRKIMYFSDYTNELGYKVLNESDKELIKLNS